MLKTGINSLFFYFLLPPFVSLFLLGLFFNIPAEFLPDLLQLYLMFTLPVLLIRFFTPFQMQLQVSYEDMKAQLFQYRLVILIFCSLILALSPLDVAVNGFKLLHPESYIDFNGSIGKHIRHFTILCWILIPAAFLIIRSRILKGLFISYALVFPIIIIDRNRLFLSFYTLFLCLVLSYKPSTAATKNNKKTLYVFLAFLCLLIFCIIGYFRSGRGIGVDSSHTLLIEGLLPLNDFFNYVPSFLQQLVIYVTTPILNFVTTSALHFTNPDFLLSQWSPFHRNLFQHYPFSPILVPRFNLGTEFYPFLLYGGWPLVIIAYSLMLASFLMAAQLFKKYANFFSFLIFIKISYNVIFMGFGPQFYILYNAMFIVLILSLWLVAEGLQRTKTPYFMAAHSQ